MAEKPSEYTLQLTMGLRFVERDGKRILQQCYEWMARDRKSAGIEWHDVPVETEEAA